jgi:hypothetical protein
MDNPIQMTGLKAPSASSNPAALPGDEVPAEDPSDRRLPEETLERPEGAEFLVSDPNARPKAFRSLSHEILFVLTATISIALPSFIQGSILIISPVIKSELNLNTAQLTWAIASSS